MRKIAAMICVLSFSGGCSGPPPAHSAESQGATPESSGRTRTYYIAADEMTWDYAPSGRNVTEERAFSDIEAHWMVRGPHEPGRIYKKALYREYTDASFATLKPRPAEWMHLGLLGPLIRAQVGDTIQVVFRNNARFPASVHPHGVFYNKDSEGARYGDGTSGADKADDGVPTGMTHTYTWQVPERAGPGAHDGSSVLWMYHSHVEEARDVASGLLGPMIVTRRGMARADGSPTDVDRELVAGFMEVDENLSWYVEDNIKANTTDPKGIKLTTGPIGRNASHSRQRQLLPRDDQRPVLLQPDGPDDEDGRARALVPARVDELRIPRAPLARQRRHVQSDAHRRRHAVADGHDGRRHGARQSGALAAALSRGRPHAHGHAGALHRREVMTRRGYGEASRVTI